MLLDIQGSSYNLYDLEIATSEIVSSGDVLGIDEIYFCAGNLATVGIQQFITQHKCNEYCNDPVGSTCYWIYTEHCSSVFGLLETEQVTK